MKRLNPTRRSRTAKTRRQQRRAGGFTLIEAALTGVIVGTGVLAMVSAQQAYHIKNNWALRTGTGQLLANEMRELMLTLQPFDPSQPTNVGVEPNEGSADPSNVSSWDDVDDFAGTGSGAAWSGVAFNPPINGLRQQIPDLAQWTQQVRVEAVRLANLDYGSEAAEAPLNLGQTSCLRVTCTVLYTQPDGTQDTITRLQWIVPTF